MDPKVTRTKLIDKEHKQADTEYITECFKREKELRQMALSTIEAKDKQLKEKDRRIAELEEREKEITKTCEEKVQNNNRQIKEYKHLIQDLTTKMASLDKKLAGEKLRCQAAEEAAARARSQINRSDPANGSHESTLGLKRKTEIISGKDISPFKKMAGNQQIIEENIQDDGGKVDLALVEYNRGKLYYVQIRGKTLIYCLKPVGQIKDNTFVHQPTQQSFILNNKDQQEYDIKFIICRMTGICDGNQIVVNKISRSMPDQLSAIQDYINNL